MPAERLTMRKAKEVLRLKWGQGLSDRQVARSCCIARSTVAEYISRAKRAGISWPLPEGLDESELEGRLFPSQPPTAVTSQQMETGRIPGNRDHQLIRILLLHFKVNIFHLNFTF